MNPITVGGVSAPRNGAAYMNEELGTGRHALGPVIERGYNLGDRSEWTEPAQAFWLGRKRDKDTHERQAYMSAVRLVFESLVRIAVRCA